MNREEFERDLMEKLPEFLNLPPEDIQSGIAELSIGSACEYLLDAISPGVDWSDSRTETLGLFVAGDMYAGREYTCAALQNSTKNLLASLALQLRLKEAGHDAVS